MSLMERMRLGIRNIKIRNKFLIPTLAMTVIIMLAVGFLIYFKSNAIIERKTEEYTMDVLHEVSKNIDYHLQEVNHLYYSIFTNSLIQASLRDANKGFESMYDQVAVRREVESFLLASILGRDTVESAYLFSNSGEIFGASLSAQRYDLSDDEKMELAKGEGRLVWLDPDPNRLTVPAGAVVNDIQTQKKIGYILITLRESALFDIYSQIKLFNNGELYVINETGRIVSHSDKCRIDRQVTEPHLVEAMEGPPTGFIRYIDAGKRYYLTYHTMPGTQWRIVNMISSVHYEKESIMLRGWILLIMAGSCLLIIPLTIWVSNTISRPIRQLSATMESVRNDGSDVYFDYESQDEVGVLGQSFNDMIDHINYLIHQVYQEQMRRQEAQLKHLIYQINPHFLFNTLDTIHWTAIMNGVPEMGRMSKLLADLIREGIKGEDFVTVEREISNIKKYAAIQKYRYGDKVEVRVDIDSEILPYYIPKFLIQPLVENAIGHGLEPKIDNGVVSIRGKLQGSSMVITVKDDGVGMDQALLDSVVAEMLRDQNGEMSHIGLSNVYHRVRIYYGEEAGLSIESELDVGTTVTITIPNGGLTP